MIETMPLARAGEAYARMMRGEFPDGADDNVAAPRERARVGRPPNEHGKKSCSYMAESTSAVLRCSARSEL